MKKNLLFLIMLLGFTLQAQQAPSTIYFANTADDIVRSANIDGTGITTAVGPDVDITFIEGVAIDPINGHIYVNDGGAPSQIIRYNLDGTNKTIIVAGLIAPDDIALDLVNGKVWWGDSGDGTIKRANLDGTGIETIINSGVGSVEGIAIDVNNERVYWANISSEIRSANWDGTDNQQVYQATSLLKLAKDMNTGVIYFTTFSDGRIFKINPDGTGLTELANVGEALGSIALDPVANEVYAAANSGIYKVGTDGSGLTQVLVNPGSQSLHLGLTFDTTFLPFDTNSPAVDLPALSKLHLWLFGLGAVSVSVFLLGRLKI